MKQNVIMIEGCPVIGTILQMPAAGATEITAEVTHFFTAQAV